MNQLFSASASKIPRLAFLLRFALLSAALLVLALTAHATKLLLGSSLLTLFLVVTEFALALLTVYIFFSRAVLPRLRDIGLYGPLCVGLALLWFVPPVNTLLTIALLLLPSDAVTNQAS
jgi:uncharacterized membrane protein YhaH (DUF805 family)